jgi:hypothetical protein
MRLGRRCESEDSLSAGENNSQKSPINQGDSTTRRQVGYQPQDFAAHGMASSRQVRRVYPELFSTPTVFPILFCGMGIKWRVNSEGVSYSGGVKLAPVTSHGLV